MFKSLTSMKVVIALIMLMMFSTPFIISSLDSTSSERKSGANKHQVSLLGKANNHIATKKEINLKEPKTEDIKVQSDQNNKQNIQQVSQVDSGRTMYVTATAYTAYCEGCSGTTYTGIDLRNNPNRKVIAVDPDVIPLGSRVWVEGYGTAIAGDIGSAIQGKRIDVFIPNYEDAMRFGVRQVRIKILD